MVTSRQKTLVQESFASLAPIAEDAMALFYRRLFELDPLSDGCFLRTWPLNTGSWRRC
jgi:hypothetical protein